VSMACRPKQSLGTRVRSATTPHHSPLTTHHSPLTTHPLQIIQRRRRWKLLAQWGQPGFQIGERIIRGPLLAGQGPMAHGPAVNRRPERADFLLAFGPAHSAAGGTAILCGGADFPRRAPAFRLECPRGVPREM